MMRLYLTVFLCALALSLPAWATTDEDVYIQEALAKRGIEKGIDKSPELAKLVSEFRQAQLARLELEAATQDGMPDFTARAKERYQARQTAQYQLPLRLRVRVLEMDAPAAQEAAVKQQLEGLRAQIASGKLDFKAAVLEHSTEPERKLTQGDTFWFHKGEKADEFYQTAEKLTQEQPLSDVFVHRGTAYLLQFIGRKAPETLPFSEVKAGIIAELQQEYRTDQEKTILEDLRAKFKASGLRP